MADNTIQAVRQAELDAAQKVREAAMKKDELLAKTEQDIRERKEMLKAQYAKLTAEALEKAEKENEALLQETIETTEKEILAMRTMIERKKAAAIQMIVTELI